MLRATEHNICRSEPPLHGFGHDPDAGFFGQDVGQALERPEGERLIQRPRAVSNEFNEPLAVGRGDRGTAPSSWGIAETIDAFGEIAPHPAPHGIIVFADNGSDLGRGKLLFSGKQDHLCPRTDPHIMRGMVERIEFLNRFRTEGR